MRSGVVLHFLLSSRIVVLYSSPQLLVVHDASARVCFLSVVKGQGWNVFSRFIPFSRAHARMRTSESLHFLLSQPSRKSSQSTVIEWVIVLFSPFLMVESFFAWRASLIHLLKYVRNMSVFICLSEGYKEICEGCESKKSKIAVRTHVRAREEGVCVELLTIWRGHFRAKTTTPPPEVEELDRNRVDGSDVMIYLPSIARRIWRESSA